MNETVISVSLEKELWEEIDKMAEEENIARSKLLGSAAKSYIKDRNELDHIYAYGESLAAEYGITEEVIAEEIRLYREEQNAKSK